MIRIIPFFCLAAAPACANPLFDGADPHAARIGDAFWIYPTEAHSQDGIFAAYRSTDLKEWKREKTIFSLKDVAWLKDETVPARAWAPAIAAKGGRFYFYYSVGPQTPARPSRIGVATGDSPTGPFTDSGKVLLTGGDGFEAIDPMVFTDPASGKSYFYAGGSDGSKLRVFEMNDDMTSFRREIETANPPHFTEGPFVHVRDGIYYLSYSNGRWNGPGYSVHYATSASPEGPWNYQGKILGSDATRKGPGHHSFVRDPETGTWFIVYHRWETSEDSGPYRGSRKIAIEPIRYTADGKIEPVTMTGAAPEPR